MPKIFGEKPLEKNSVWDLCRFCMVTKVSKWGEYYKNRALYDLALTIASDSW